MEGIARTRFTPKQKAELWDKHPGYAMWMLGKAEIPEISHV